MLKVKYHFNVVIIVVIVSLIFMNCTPNKKDSANENSLQKDEQ
jgi:hypothetical protein